MHYATTHHPWEAPISCTVRTHTSAMLAWLSGDGNMSMCHSPHRFRNVCNQSVGVRLECCPRQTNIPSLTWRIPQTRVYIHSFSHSSFSDLLHKRILTIRLYLQELTNIAWWMLLTLAFFLFFLSLLFLSISTIPIPARRDELSERPQISRWILPSKWSTSTNIRTPAAV